MNVLRLIFALLALSLLPLPAAQTAYQALSVVREKWSDSGMQKLIELTGQRGGPEPQSWKMLFNDPAARGGVREVVVSNGAITSERTPLSGFSGAGSLPTLSLSQLNLDSSKVFLIANQAARNAGVGFHWIDYTLRADAETRLPIWILQLTDYMGAPVGSMTVSAQSGKTLRSLQLDSNRTRATQSSSRNSGEPIGGVIGEAEALTQRTANQVKDGSLRVVGNVQEWLTGRRTIGPEGN